MVIILLSPAKTLCWDAVSNAVPALLPSAKLLRKSDDVAQVLKAMPPAQIKSLLSVSQPLAALNNERYQHFKLSDELKGHEEDMRQAGFAYDGAAFQGLEAKSLSDEDLAWAQQSLCILTGMYGVVSPLELIQPYRLEMHTKLAVGSEKARPMHEHWREAITQHIKDKLEQQPGPKVVVNVASQEYSKAVDLQALRDSGARIITCDFKDGGRTVSVVAKRSRGLMARYIITQRISDVRSLCKFDLEGYAHSPEQSSGDTLVFTRSTEARLAAAPATAKGGAKTATGTAAASVKKRSSNGSKEIAAADDVEIDQTKSKRGAKKQRT